MNADRMTRILTSHLECRTQEIRIYREKMIGTNVCDVMAVTDQLTGYEVKSDVDDYSRLVGQIKAYDLYFDRNFLVVGEAHRQSAAEHIPMHWGIICIADDKVEVVREAGLNKKVSRRDQLRLLWKIELKNLLVKNGLPLYGQRDKAFLADKLFSSVEPASLGRQIAEELFHRDYSIFEEAESEREQPSYIGFTQAALTDALSEENFEELTLDKWIELYRNARAIGRKKNVIEQKMKERRTHEISYQDIEVSLGVPWVSPEIINDFIYHLLELDKRKFRDFRDEWVKNRQPFAFHERVTGNWVIHGKNWLSDGELGTSRWGTLEYNALQILEATLNICEIKLYDRNKKFDEASTLAALEKQKLIIQEFKRWVWEDEDRRWEIEEEYNRIFAGKEPQEYDGSHLTFPDMNPNIELFDYQKNAVARILSTPNTLLAFDVGAGKTFIMIAAAMEMRRQGMSRKNLFVVPNNIVGQWEEMFLRLYPNARILAIEPKSFRPELRHKVLTQVRDGDYDGIIIGYSCFEFIKLSEDFVVGKIKEKIDELRAACGEVRQSPRLQTALEREMQSFKTTMSKLLQSYHALSDEITFDKLEINSLFLDEAHNFKNVPLRTRLDNIRGVNPTGSVKCLNMLQKVRCVQEQNGGRGVIFATGTPLSNSISDAFTMQLYLQPETLKARHLDCFDNWVKTFAQPEQSFEIDVNISAFRIVRRFVRFFNLPELSRMFSEVTAFYSMEKNGLPAFSDYSDEVISASAAVKEYLTELCGRTEKIRAKEVHPSKDNMLKITTDGRAAALDLTLVDRLQIYDAFSKLVRCVRNVANVYRENIGCSQLIFCDNSTPKSSGFSVYAEIKRQLRMEGIPEQEIAFIHSYHAESAKLKLYDEVNSGKIRVLIGSTFKLGIGANVQTKLKAIHHLDVPWRPADMVQREGRILRRGNENEEVYIFRYIIEGSFDAYSWQILETKQRFISQFLSGQAEGRTLSDLEDNILSYAEVKALALSQPEMKQLAEKENELRNLRILSMKHAETLETLKRQLETLKEEITEREEQYKTSCKNLEYVHSAAFAFEKEEVVCLAEALLPALLFNPLTIIGNLREFTMRTPSMQSEKKPFVVFERLRVAYALEVGESVVGNVRRFVNFFARFEEIVATEIKVLEEMKVKRRDLEAQLAAPRSYRQQIEQCTRERDELLNSIRSRLSEE